MKNIVCIKIFVFLTLTSMFVYSCSSTVNLSDNAAAGERATVVDNSGDAGVDMTIEKINEKKVDAGELTSIEISPGEHKLTIRIDSTPASGSSIILGGWGNLLARAATNQSFRTDLLFKAEPGHKYVVGTGASDDKFIVMVFDETSNKEVASQAFAYKDGKFESLF